MIPGASVHTLSLPFLTLSLTRTLSLILSLTHSLSQSDTLSLSHTMRRSLRVVLSSQVQAARV